MGTSQLGNEGAGPKNQPQSWQIETDAIAKIELATAIIHYELSRPGLGERFRLAVEAQVLKISQRHFVYQRLTPTHYRSVMRIFPYIIYFAVQKKRHRIFILNIHHGKRHPKNWRRHHPLWRT